MVTEAPGADRLRVLIADERRDRMDDVASVVDSLGHEVVALPLNVGEIAEATRSQRPDVAIVVVGDETEHALELISEIVRQAACPVIVNVDSSDGQFIDEAAKRGIFAQVRHAVPEELENAMDIVLRRYAEFSRLEGAMGRRATIEQAKGILMERHGLDADHAFEELRRHARSHNQTVLDVADAVTRSYPLFRSRETDG